MENYFNYFTEVEEYFSRLRGRHLLVSPIDWCLIELWKDSGVPLHVALRGIDRSFESASARSQKPPQSLFYCHPAVMEAFQQHTSAHIGASEEHEVSTPGQGFTRDNVGRFLTRIEDSLAAHAGEVFERARGRIEDLIGEVEKRQNLNFEEVDRSLSAVAEMISEGLLEAMDPDALKLLRGQARRDLKTYRKHLSKESYQKLLDSYLQRHAREEHGLPSFSLFDLDPDTL